MADWRDSRTLLAIRYNELGNRIQDLREMQLSIVEDGQQTGDHLATFLGCNGAEKEIAAMTLDMETMDRRMTRDQEWVDHWRVN